MEKNIVIIDNNFAIREMLKVILEDLASSNDVSFNLYTSQNGIEGLGYVYITHPDLVIIDTTLPKYNGNELLYFLLTNKKFHTKNTKIIVITEKKQIIRVPANFKVITKSSNNFTKKLRETVADFFEIENQVNYKHSKLINSIIKLANSSDIFKVNFEKNSLLRKLLTFPILLIKEFLISILMVLNNVVNGRVKDSNVKQERRNLSLLRRRHYPTAIAGSVGIVMTGILTLSVFFSQNIFFKQVNEETEAFGFGQVGWFSTMDNNSDISNPVTGSAGEALNGVDYVTQNIVVDEEYSYDIISARFDADTEVVRIANPIIGEDFSLDKGTVEFMYSPLEAHTTDKEMTFFSIYADANNKIEFKKLNDTEDSLSLIYKCTYCNDAEVKLSGADYYFDPNDWVKFVVHWNAYAPINEQLLIYVDEQELPLDRNTGSINPASITAPSYLYIGNSSPTGTNEANGRIDDFTLYHDVAQPVPTPIGTPAPTPVFWQNSGQASWYSTFDSMDAVTTPAVGDVPGVFSGASFIDGPSPYNSALYFDQAGTSLYIEGTQGVHYSLNEGAVEFYYRPIYDANYDDEVNLFTIRQNDNEEIRFYKKNNADGNELSFAFHCQTDCGGEETIALSEYDSFWNPEEWVYFRVTWNDNSTLNLAEQMKIFIDGTQPTHTNQEFKILGDNITSEPNPLRVYVGNRTENGDDSAMGTIDEFKMFTTTVIPTATITPTPSLTPTPSITPVPSVVPTATPSPLWHSTLDSLSAIQNPVIGSGATVVGKVTYLDGSPYVRGDNNKAVKTSWHQDGNRIVANVGASEINESVGRVSFHLSPRFASYEFTKERYFQLYRDNNNRIMLYKNEYDLELHYLAKASGSSNYNILTIPQDKYEWFSNEWVHFEIYYNVALDQDNEIRLFMSRSGGDFIEPEHTHENTVTTAMQTATQIYLSGDPSWDNLYIRGKLDDFKYYGYSVNIPTPTVPVVSPTPSSPPEMSILWYSTLANPTAAWQPVIGTTPTAVYNVTFATDGTPETKSAAVFNATQSNIHVSVQNSDYHKYVGKMEFWYKPAVPYTQNNRMTFYRLRTMSYDKISFIKGENALSNYLEFQYDASCINTGNICDNNGTGAVDNRRTRIAQAEYSSYWTVGKWMKFETEWDYYAPTEAEKLKVFITYHNGSNWVRVEPAKTTVSVMNPTNFDPALMLIIGSGNYYPNATQIARGNISDFKIWGIGAGLTPTPSPTPVSRTSADPIWYSTMDDLQALTTPVIGKGVTSQNITFDTGVTGNGTRIDANSEHITIAAIPYATPPVSIKKDKGAIEFYYKPLQNLASTSSMMFIWLNVDVNNRMTLWKDAGAGTIWYGYRYGGVTRNINITGANYSSHWEIDKWMKIRLEWDRTKTYPNHLKMFINNQLLTSSASGGTVFNEFSGDPHLIIGNYASNGVEPVMGIIDDFSIYADPDTRKFVVNSTLDEGDANVGDLDCSTASGVCTLRAAIQEANTSSAPDKIVFNIPGSGPHSINITSALPSITNPVEIDATTQTDTNCTTKDLRVVLSGDNLSNPGLSFSNTTAGVVKGLVIHGFNKGINYTASTGGTVSCNIIGLGQDGSTVEGNSEAGVYVESSSNSNIIGGDTGGSGNIISGNSKGIVFSSSNNNVVQGNYIGTNKTGDSERGNTSAGIEINNSTGIEIGDADLNSLPVACTGVCNVISGNGGSGIYYTAGSSGSNDNVIEGNYIGVDKTGATQVTNDEGLKVTKASGLNISFNMITSSSIGLYASSSSADSISTLTVDNNYIGINRNANAVTMDSAYGIVLFSNGGFSTATISNNIIVGAVRNAGIYAYGSSLSGVTIKSNYIGTNSADAELGNKYGIHFFAPTATNNVIGGPNLTDGNIIAQNSSHGIYISSGTENTLVKKNTIRNNANDGVHISGSQTTENITMIENSIYDNSGMGINLRTTATDKVSYNDKDDTDSTSAGDGPNNLQNFPVLTKATYVGTTLSIYGGFQSEIGKYYRLDFYSSESNDDTGFGEGQNHFHTIDGVAGSPDYNFSVTPIVVTSLTLPADHKYISATATECGEEACSTLLSTSEFGLTGFDGHTIGKGLELDSSTPTFPRFYVAADGTENIPDLYAFDILLDKSLDIVAGINTIGNMSATGIVGLDYNNFASVGFANGEPNDISPQYQIFNILDGYQCGYTIGSNIKATEIKIEKNGMGSKYVYITSDSTNEELTLLQGESASGGYAKYGEYLSEVKDMGTPVRYYHSIVWDEAKNGGELKLQIRSGDSSNLTNEEWYGPDGTRGTFFTLSGTNEGYVLPKVIQGKRYIQYRVLIESDQLQSPALNSITIRYGD
jgi:CSLREA domain-containing protein